MTRLGKRLQKARRERGLTQEEVARELGLTRVTVLNYEKDVSVPKPPALRALAEILGVSEAWLVSGRGGAPRGAKAAGLPAAAGTPCVEFVDVSIVPARPDAAAVRERTKRVVSVARASLPHPSRCLAVEADDDSMSPKIVEGDLVVFDALATEPSEALVGGLFTVKIQGRLKIRKITSWRPERKILTLQSEGGAGAPKESLSLSLAGEAANLLVGRVVMILRRG